MQTVIEDDRFSRRAMAIENRLIRQLCRQFDKGEITFEAWEAGHLRAERRAYAMTIDEAVKKGGRI